MNKLTALRAHILSIPGEIKIEPDDLLTFTDGGRVVADASGTNDHFELKYKANVVITNYSGLADQLVFWLLLWLKINQPDHPTEAIQFEADILNDDSADLSITLDLSETIKVEETVDGILLNHVDEPSIEPVLLPAQEWNLFLLDDPNPVETWLQDG